MAQGLEGAGVRCRSIPPRERREVFSDDAGRRLPLSAPKSILSFASETCTFLRRSERGTGPVSVPIKHVLVFVTV